MPSALVVTVADAGPTVGGFVADERTGYAVMTTPATRGAVVRLSLPAPGSEGPRTVPRKNPGVGLGGGGGGGAPVLSFPAVADKPLKGDADAPVGSSLEHATSVNERSTNDTHVPRNDRVVDTVHLQCGRLHNNAPCARDPYAVGQIVVSVG